MKKRTKSAMKKEADRLFSLAIRGRDKHCVDCGTTAFLQCAHLFSRRYLATRFDARNAVTLCRGCHLKYTVRPLEWDNWMLDHWGADLYAEMRALALSGERPDYESLVAELKAAVK